MTRNEVKSIFRNDGDINNKDCKVLVRLQQAGWIENCPQEDYWNFVHPSYLGYEVRWYHFDGEVVVIDHQ